MGKTLSGSREKPEWGKRRSRLRPDDADSKRVTLKAGEVLDVERRHQLRLTRFRGLSGNAQDARNFLDALPLGNLPALLLRWRLSLMTLPEAAGIK